MKPAYRYKDLGRTVCSRCHRAISRPGWLCSLCEEQKLAEIRGEPVPRFFLRRTDQEQWLIIDGQTGFTTLESYNAEAKAQHVCDAYNDGRLSWRLPSDIPVGT